MAYKNPLELANQLVNEPRKKGGYYTDSYGRSNWYENEEQIMDDYRKGWLKKLRAQEIAADLQLPDLIFEGDE